jgi:hypothetical protein
MITDKINSIPVCIVSSTETEAELSDPIQNTSDQLAQQLKELGFNVYKSFITITPFPDNPHGVGETRLQYIDYYTKESVSIENPSVYVFIPNKDYISLLNALFKILLSIAYKPVKNKLVILTPKAHWQGLITWARESMLYNKQVDLETIDRILLLDNTDEIISSVLSFCNE